MFGFGWYNPLLVRVGEYYKRQAGVAGYGAGGGREVVSVFGGEVIRRERGGVVIRRDAGGEVTS